MSFSLSLSLSLSDGTRGALDTKALVVDMVGLLRSKQKGQQQTKRERLPYFKRDLEGKYYLQNRWCGAYEQVVVQYDYTQQ
jgi:hypothetical protein